MVLFIRSFLLCGGAARACTVALSTRRLAHATRHSRHLAVSDDWLHTPARWYRRGVSAPRLEGYSRRTLATCCWRVASGRSSCHFVWWRPREPWRAVGSAPGAHEPARVRRGCSDDIARCSRGRCGCAWRRWVGRCWRARRVVYGRQRQHAASRWWAGVGAWRACDRC